MTIEIRILAFTVVLGILQLFLATAAATKQRGSKWNMSSRDGKAPELTGMAGRLDRALKNFLETYPFFIASIVVAHLANRLGPMSTLGAEIYLAARVLYVPAYAFGITGVRTLIWLGSIVGIGMVLFAGLWS